MNTYSSNAEIVIGHIFLDKWFVVVNFAQIIHRGIFCSWCGRDPQLGSHDLSPLLVGVFSDKISSVTHGAGNSRYGVTLPETLGP